MPRNSANRTWIPLFALALHMSVIAFAVVLLFHQILGLLEGYQIGTSFSAMAIAVSARIVATGLLVYIGMASYKNVPSRNMAWAHFIWLFAFVWYGWFYSGSPFILHEVLGPDTSRSAQLFQQFSLAIRFIILAFVFSGIPLWLGHRDKLNFLADSRARLFGILRWLSIVMFSICICLVLIITRVFTMENDSVYLFLGLLLIIALVSAAFCSAARQKGALALLFIEALLAPLLRFLYTGPS